MIIGITGKSGVGKTTYANHIAHEKGYRVIHIDEISHYVMDKDVIRQQLIAVFGSHIVQQDGTLDRRYIGDLVFTHRHLYKALNNIVWDEMKKEIDEILSKENNVVLDWILLPHSHYWNMCDTKILVLADEEQRKLQVMKRDNISPEYLSKRDSASISYCGIKFDMVITNTYNAEW